MGLTSIKEDENWFVAMLLLDVSNEYIPKIFVKHIVSVDRANHFGGIFPPSAAFGPLLSFTYCISGRRILYNFKYLSQGVSHS